MAPAPAAPRRRDGRLFFHAIVVLSVLLVTVLVIFSFVAFIGIVLVVFSFNLAFPIAQLASTVTRSTLGIAMACVMLSFLMMITRRKAMPQVIGFLSMENGLFFAATSATYGMPMVVELGIALDVLVGVLILGVFFFQIREQFESLDLHHLETLLASVRKSGRVVIVHEAPRTAGGATTLYELKLCP